MKNQNQESFTEKVWREEQEFLKNNQEEVVKKVDKAAAHRKEHGFSRTMAKLMEKYDCKTVEEYRVVRKANKVANKVVKVVAAPVTNNKNNNNKKR